MKFNKRIFFNLSSFVPRKYRKLIEELLLYGGERKLKTEEVVGFTFLIGVFLFLISILLSALIYHEIKISFILYGVLGFLFVHFLVYMVYYFRVEDRTNKIERALPDFFQLVAANIRSGMTPYEAMKFASRDEFGPLKVEIDYITARSLGTSDFSSILVQISNRVKSELLDRSFKLFSSAMRSGGRIADLLDDLAKDITETRSLKNELATSTKTYVMFILFTVLVAMPLLLALAINFLDILTNLQSLGGGGDFSVVGNLTSELAIDSEFMSKVAIVMVILTTTFSSILMGVIKEGNMKYGLRYAFVLIFIGLVLFFVLKNFLSGFLGGIV